MTRSESTSWQFFKMEINVQTRFIIDKAKLDLKLKFRQLSGISFVNKERERVRG